MNKILISVLLALLLFSAVNNGCQRKRVINLVEDLTTLNVENDILKKQNDELNTQLDSTNSSYKKIEAKLKLSDSIRIANENTISNLRHERDSLKDFIIKTPTNILYTWLDEIRYPYDGDRIYKFNEPQVKDIYFDVKDLDITKKENEVLTSDISECNYQLFLKDSLIENRLSSINLLTTSLENKDKVIGNLEQKITLTEKQVKKYKRKLFFWKVGTGIAITGLIIAL